MLVGLPLASGGLLLVSLLHHRVGHRLPEGVGSFLAGAAAPKRIMLRAGLILVVTWVARWFGVLFLLHAVGVHAGVGAALLYMVVTGLANTMPFLPGQRRPLPGRRPRRAGDGRPRRHDSPPPRRSSRPPPAASRPRWPR